jgi:small subunit ribosomal protein S1
MKALEPTSIDEYIAENKVGDVVAGRILDVSGSRAKVELGEGVIATCQLPEQNAAQQENRRSSGTPKRTCLRSPRCCQPNGSRGAESRCGARCAAYGTSPELQDL